MKEACLNIVFFYNIETTPGAAVKMHSAAVRVVPVLRGEVNEGEVGYYYDPYHRTISGIPLQ